jgi:hypothetical protein
MLIIGKLPPQGRQHAHNPLGWHAGIDQTFSGFQKEQILKRELEGFFWTPHRCKKTGADE